MEERKNLCAQIPISLHNKVRQEQQESGKGISFGHSGMSAPVATKTPSQAIPPIGKPTKCLAIGSEDKPVRCMEKALRLFPSP